MNESIASPPELGLPTARDEDNEVDVPILDKPYTRILEAIERGGGFNMLSYHGGCGTTHCIAGWTTHLCGAQGYKLENTMGDCGDAAELILNASSELIAPSFDPDDYSDDGDDDEADEVALAELRRLARLEAAACQSP